MESAIGYTCGCCGEHHDELPLSYRTQAPDFWAARQPFTIGNRIDSDLCVIGGEHFFIQGNIEIPIVDSGQTFAWGVWVSLSATNFAQAEQLWTTPGRELEPPYFGWLSTELPVYDPPVLNLKTNVHTREVGLKPLVELEPTDHPLSVEQRTGITMARAQEIAELVLHPGSRPR